MPPITQCLLGLSHKELDLTMAFCGHTDSHRVDRSVLLPHGGPWP